MEALAPPQHGEQQQGEGVALNHTVSGCPLSRHEQPTSHAEGLGFRAPPEYQEVIWSDLNINLVRETLETNVAPSSSKVDSHTDQTAESGESLQVLNSESSTGAISTANLIEDAKFYQDAAIWYQDAYETLWVQQEELQH